MRAQFGCKIQPLPLSGYILAHARSSHGRGPVPGQSMWRRVGGLVYIPAAAIAALSAALRTAGEGMVSQQRNGDLCRIRTDDT